MSQQDGSLSVAAHILGKAVQLHESGFYNAAVVTAQSACEVACEWAIARLLARRGAAYLHECLDQMIGSYNPAGRVRDLYVALSGDRIQDQPFWPTLTDCVKLRNRVVHEGEQVSADEAARYLAVAQQVISYLEQQCCGAGEMIALGNVGFPMNVLADTPALPHDRMIT